MNRERISEIDSYLFGEMDADVQESFEQQFLADDDMFYEIAERENELVDRFVHGNLDADIEKRFRNSLSRFPARQKKIANAATLQAFIKNETGSAPVQEKAPWYQRLGFAFRTPAFAAAALGMVLIAMIGLLLVQNRNLNDQLARLNTNGSNISELRQREAELQAEIESLRTSGGDLTTDLEAERERRAALESELADLRKQIGNAKPTNSGPIVPTIATLVLRPVGIRGGPEPVRRLRIDNDEKRVALKIYLPSESSEGTFGVRVNDVYAGRVIKPVKETSGAGSISVSVQSESFRNGMNRVEVVDQNSQTVLSFAVLCERGQVR